MEEQKETSRVRFMFRVLRRLMDGEKLTVRDVLKNAPMQDAAVRRHLESMEEIIPGVQSIEKRPRRWYYSVNSGPAPERPAALALKMCRAMLPLIHGSKMDKCLKSFCGDFFRQLPDGTSVPHDVSRIFFAKTHSVPSEGFKAETVDMLVNAIVDQRRVSITYEHFEGNLENIELEPYTLVFADPGLYCYGRCAIADADRHTNTERIFNIMRIRHARLSRNSFTYPERHEYDPEKVFEHCFGIFFPASKEEQPETVVLRFGSRWKHYLKTHRWHKSQTLPEEQSDCTLLVKLKVYLTDDFVRFIRGKGDDVEVVFPDFLKRRVQSDDHDQG